MRFQNTPSIEQDPSATRAEDGSRLPVAFRWWFDAQGALHDGWPAPDQEHEALSMGWVAADRPIGVIEFPVAQMPPNLLERLEARFPTRRWFAGTWDHTPTGHQINRAA